VQNFGAIGPLSSEITRGEKNKIKNKPQQNFSPFPQAMAYGRTKKKPQQNRSPSSGGLTIIKVYQKLTN